MTIKAFWFNLLKTSPEYTRAGVCEKMCEIIAKLNRLQRVKGMFFKNLVLYLA